MTCALMLKLTFTCLLFLIACGLVNAQVIDNSAAFRNSNSTRYLRLCYDNDYFTATDDYYTQGINFEFVSPVLKKFPVSKILIHASSFQAKYGIAVETEGYTPASIAHNDILAGDRPFAACLFLKTFSVATDTVTRVRLSSDFSIGVMGRAAGGGWMQMTIHRWLNNVQPHGWQNQIANDAILNYEVSYERQLFSCNNFLMLNVYGQLRAGTLSDKTGAGITLMFGKFNSPFSAIGEGKSKLEVYFYDQPVVYGIGYDATLQGGLFNHNSPYTIAARDIERITFQDNAGLVFSFRKIYLEYAQSFLTKEFRTGTYHRWGGIRIGTGF